MFKKIVSNAAFSPALVGQLGFYARRLKKEEATRRAGVIFTVLALILQSFAVFSPPEPANAASSNDLIYGGITSKTDLLNNYDSNEKFRKIITYAGITREELAATTEKTINNLSGGTGEKAWKSWGYNSFFSPSQGEVKYVVDSSTTVYARPNYLFNSTPYEKEHGKDIRVLYGASKRLGHFGIMFACGNVFIQDPPNPPPPPPPPPPPAFAACTSLDTLIHSYNERRFMASATVKNGATISNYSFTVRDKNNTVVKAFNYKSSSTSVTTGNVAFDPGTYTAQVSVNTSEGIKTSDDCRDSFTISKPGITIEKSVEGGQSAKIQLNTPYTYTVVVKNTGSVRLTDVAVSDLAPPNVDFLSSSAGTITNRKSWQHNILVINSGQEVSFTIKAQVTKPAEPGQTIIKNTACVNAKEIDGDKDGCDDADVSVPEVTIKVCDLVTNKIVTINKSDFNKERYSTNLEDCTMIEVCDTATDTITTIRKTAFDKTKHSLSLDQCSDIQVCDLSSGEIIKIKKNDFDQAKHSKQPSDCVPKIAVSKKANNMTQKGVDASTTVAKSSEIIEYSITVQNVGDVDAEAKFVENLADVMEYSTIYNSGGGEYNKETNQLTWPSVMLKPDEKRTQVFTVKLLSAIPEAAQGTSHPASYDCKMTNTFGNSIDVKVDCPIEKEVEQTISQLPRTGAGSNMLFAAITLAVVAYFYARSRQMKTEMRLIRHDYNSGLL